MIGFEINATGSHGFKWAGGAWTEGSLWLAKTALKAVPRSPENKGSAVLVDGIEAQFSQLKDVMMNKIASLGLNLHLTVTGDFNFMYQFQSGKRSSQTLNELLQIIANQEEDMGDQVALQFCRCLLDFRLHVVTRNLSDLKLKMNIDL